MVLGAKNDPSVDEVVRDRLAQSDQGFVKCRSKHGVQTMATANLGRVSWASYADWEKGLEFIENSIEQLNSATAALLQCESFSPQVFGGTAGQKQRRGLLDMTAWARDVLYVTV